MGCPPLEDQSRRPAWARSFRAAVPRHGFAVRPVATRAPGIKAQLEYRGVIS